MRFLALAFAAACSGCAGGLLIGPQEEVKIGKGVDDQIEQEYRIVEANDPLTTWAKKLVDPLAKASAKFRDPAELGGYKVEVIADDKLVNAFAAPGGYVYITTGLVKSAKTCAEIAGVLGHELAHVTQKHSVKQLEQAFAAQTLAAMFLGEGLSSDAALTIFGFLQQTKFSQAHETESDKVGLQIAYRAGYNPYGLADFFKALLALEKGGGGVPQFLSSHPATDERIREVKRQIERLYGDKVQPGKTQTYECRGTNMTLAQAQAHIKSGNLKVRGGTGQKKTK